MSAMGCGWLDTPLGPLSVVSVAGRIERLLWRRSERAEPAPEIREALRQLAAYFDGRLTAFDLPLHVRVSPFQQAACDAMRAIPFGQTRTYGALARDLGVTAQAMGGACGGNPIPVIIPCHRVLGADGLGGYSGQGGIETKVLAAQA